MKATLHPKLVAGRIRTGPSASDDTYGHTGMFEVTGPNGALLRIIANDDTDPIAASWEHVSVSLPGRCPNWPEMCFVKNLFWEPEETVVQFHCPESSYINNHPWCLHMWRLTTLDHPLPPPLLVGLKDAGVIKSAAEAYRLKQQVLATFDP